MSDRLFLLGVFTEIKLRSLSDFDNEVLIRRELGEKTPLSFQKFTQQTDLWKHRLGRWNKTVLSTDSTE